MGVLRKPYFRGQSVLRLDEKGRLKIPTKFRDVLQNHYSDAVVVTMLQDCLVAYPPEAWELIEAKAKEFSVVQPEHRAFMRYFISSAEECEFDNKGRILIPPLLRERAGLGSEVLVAGVLTNFEIWDRARWESHINWDKDTYNQIMLNIADTGL